MDQAGAQEVLLPIASPAELWQESGPLGDVRQRVWSALKIATSGLLPRPTHEEVITDRCAQRGAPYRALPFNLYQIQTKFRDEVRPRFGLMRAANLS